MRIDGGLVGLGDGGHAERSFAVHEDGHQIGAVAAEVEESAGTVLGGIGEPGEKLGADADLFGPFVAVMHDYLADLAQFALQHLVVDLLVAGIPCGLIIHQYLDVVLAGRSADGESIAQTGCERLLYHGGYAVASSGLDNLAMILRCGVDKDRIGMLLHEHALEVGVEETGVEVVADGVALDKGLVGFDDGDELDIWVLGERPEEAAGVIVDQTDDGDANGLGGFIPFIGFICGVERCGWEDQGAKGCGGTEKYVKLLQHEGSSP